MSLTIRPKELAAALTNELWPLVVFGLGLIVAWLFAYCSSWYVGEGELPFSKTVSHTVRRMGMMLQLLGVSTVAFGLRNLRHEFLRPSVTENVLKGFTRVISSFIAPKPISAVMIKVLDDVTLTADAHVATTVGTEATLDERIAAIEENLTRLRAAIQAKNGWSKTRTCRFRGAHC